MEKINTYSHFILLVPSVFFISVKFVNPSESTYYFSIILSCLLVAVGMVLRYKQQKFSMSATETLLATAILIIGFRLFCKGLNVSSILWLFSLGLYYAFSKRTEISIMAFFTGLSLLGFSQSIYGIGQYCCWWPNIAAPAFRISGSFDNPAGFAVTLVACLPFALRMIQEAKWYYVCLGVASVVVMIAGIALAQSRAGIVAGVIVMVVWLFQILPNKWQKRWNRKGVIALVSIVVLLLLSSLYFWKKNSADGRLLIWQCSTQMIADKPLLGHGTGGFQREYMFYQADYFKQHPDSKYVQLADIVKHPFNEYLLLLVEYGLMGAVFMGIFLWLMIRQYRQKLKCVPSSERAGYKEENHVFLHCLVGIGVFACFSYPFCYPFVGLIAVLSAGGIMQGEPETVRIPALAVKTGKPVLVVLLLGIFVLTAKMFYNEYNWNKIAGQSLAGETHKVLPEYAQLYPWMRGEWLFLYNYAAELNYIGEWKNSNKLMTECAQLYNDNDVQLIFADNLQQLKKYAAAEKHLKLAYEMIPNRFVPLYRLVQLYKLQGRIAEAQKLAKQIICKPVKVPSYDVAVIKREMQELIDMSK